MIEIPSILITKWGDEIVIEVGHSGTIRDVTKYEAFDLITNDDPNADIIEDILYTVDGYLSEWIDE